MSDFVARLAARAVAETPRARPASPQVAAERTVARATPSAPDVRSEGTEVPVEPEQPRPPVPKAQVAHPSFGERVVDATVVPDAAAPPREQVEAVPAREPASEPVRVVHAVPLAAAPTSIGVVETSAAQTHAVASPPTGEPPVRVHIGRLEVRANLAQPLAPPPPRRKPAASEELSLADYLRGRRTA